MTNRQLIPTLVVLAAAITATTVSTNAADWEKVESVDMLLKDLGVWDAKPYSRRAGGVWVDPNTSDVYVDVARKPIYRSTDGCQNWTQWGPDWLTGKLNRSTALGIDYPYRGRMLLFGKHGKSGLTLDGGKTWKELPGELVHGDTNWAAKVPTVIVAHGDHGKYSATTDGGKTWHRNGAVGRYGSIGYDCLGLIDENTMLVARGLVRVKWGDPWKPVSGIYTTTNLIGPWDYEKDFTKVSGLTPLASNPQHWDSRMYWAAVEGVIVSENGKDWKVHGTPIPNVRYLVFGRSENEMLVMNDKACYVSTDGAESWKRIAPVFLITDGAFKAKPGDLRQSSLSLGWDPKGKVVYASPLNGSLYRTQYSPKSSE
ncbi:MAG: hypothetical protein MI757_09795 [Pirellulales bacterium]|nr:hypothetical protein [Pirellulales bacterium]